MDPPGLRRYSFSLHIVSRRPQCATPWHAGFSQRIPGSMDKNWGTSGRRLSLYKLRQHRKTTENPKEEISKTIYLLLEEEKKISRVRRKILREGVN